MLIVEDAFFGEDELQPCLDYLAKAPWSFGWKSNLDVELCYGHWNTDITNTDRFNEKEVSALPQPFQTLWDKLKAVIPSAALVRCYANQHTFGTEGTIHTDTETDNQLTCVIYMNKEWSPYWGGETAFYDYDVTDIARSVLPKFGRVAVFSGNVPHCARALSRTCDSARMTLMFKFTVDPKAVLPTEERLYNFLRSIGAHKQPHKDGPLIGHLMRTYQLMVGMNLPEALCLGGGLHSVYGTSSYKKTTIPLDSTIVADTFGPEADRFARMFHDLKRPTDLMDGSTLAPEDLFAMRCIEVANLHDQNELQHYPHLVEFLNSHIQK
jgi:SM-20-related protein